MRRLCCSAPAIHRKFTYPLLPTVDLMSDRVSRPFGFPRQLFHGHLPVQLRQFGSELVLFASTLVPSRRHVFHQRPQVQSVGIVTDDRSTRSSGLPVLCLTYLGDPFLVVSLKDYRWTTHNTVFLELMKIFILLVEDRKVGLLQ